MTPQTVFLLLMQGLAVVLQLAAAIVALRLIPLTGWRVSWLAVSTALWIMALRRAFFIWQQLANGIELPAFLLFDGTLATAISLLMLLSVLTISPLFQTIKRSEENLRQSAKVLEAQVAARTAELRAAKEQLEAEHHRLYAVMDALPALVYLKAPDYTLRFANRLFRHQFGDAAGLRCYEAFGGTEVCKKCSSKRVLETGLPVKEEWTKTDGTRTYELSHYPFSDQDDLPMVLTLAFDITDRKRMEEELRQSRARLEEAQHLAHVGSWEWDVAQDESRYSREMFQILGLPPLARGLGHDEFLSQVHPDDREGLQRAMEKALAGEKPCALGFRMLRPDGAEIYVHLEAEILCDPAGRPMKMVGTLQDITSRYEGEEKLRESEACLHRLTSDLLNAQEKERGRIARELHDGLGQSLMAVKLQMSSIYRRSLAGNKAIAVDCGAILENMTKLVEEVRRISRDLTPAILTDLGLETALQRLLADFAKYHHLEVHSPGDFTGLNHAFPTEDQIHIYRIFQECLANIGKHSGAASVVVSVAQGEREISFLLADDGRGFDLAAISKSGSGLKGMGLATLQERARLLGGKLDIASEPGKGTKMHLVLPVSFRE